MIKTATRKPFVAHMIKSMLMQKCNPEKVLTRTVYLHICHNLIGKLWFIPFILMEVLEANVGNRNI